MGGTLPGTWTYAQNYGILSEKCFPYVSGTGGYVPRCPAQCAYSGDQFYRFKANAGSYREYRDPESIKNEIATNGPASTWMKTFEDFSAYKGGIYKYSWGRETDPHAIIIVGYGTELGTPYWIVRNSWGPTWGEAGYFRIGMNGPNLIDRNVGVSTAPIYQ